MIEIVLEYSCIASIEQQSIIDPRTRNKCMLSSAVKTLNYYYFVANHQSSLMYSGFHKYISSLITNN